MYQSLVLCGADTRHNAESIAKAVHLEYGEAEGRVIVDTADAVRSNAFFQLAEGEDSVSSGDAAGTYWCGYHVCMSVQRFAYVAAISKADMTISGQIECGSQYHFTMETQAALVVPTEDHTYSVYSSTQWVGYVQAAVANVLGIPSSRYIGWPMVLVLTGGTCIHACLDVVWMCLLGELEVVMAAR